MSVYDCLICCDNKKNKQTQNGKIFLSFQPTEHLEERANILVYMNTGDIVSLPEMLKDIMENRTEYVISYARGGLITHTYFSTILIDDNGNVTDCYFSSGNMGNNFGFFSVFRIYKSDSSSTGYYIDYEGYET